MKIFLTLITILTLNSFCFSQEREIKGKIVDIQSNLPLPYVNIGIANKGVGTVSNDNGAFILKLNENIKMNDSVIFSYLGYTTQKIKVAELNSKINNILLEPEINALKEVVIVKTKTPKLKKIGRTSKGFGLMHANFYTYYEKDVDDRLSKEIGMQLEIKKNCQINSLNFNITSNDFKKLKFRVNFYKIKNGLPDELIVNQNIIFEIDNEFLGWFTVDLKPYDIYFESDTGDIVVTIQWVESEKANSKSKYFAISTAVSPLNTAFFREKAMDVWTKSNQSLSFYLDAMCN
ncbi:MAG: carboxypeptidase-like regulatory domain-containing protein [Lutibacter sp.]